MKALLLVCCIIASISLSCCSEIASAVSGVYSTKAESEGLHLPATSTWQPIGVLTVQINLIRKHSVFVNYQITVFSSGDLRTKLQLSYDDNEPKNAGSLVQYSNQNYKTATGYWMGNLQPGYYTFEVHYISSTDISVLAGLEYQTAILQVMWFRHTRIHAVSDGVKCYPNPNPLNQNGVLSPIKDLKVNLLHRNGVILAAYQIPIYSSSDKSFVTKLYKNNQQLRSTNMIHGNKKYLNLNSLWAEYESTAEYEFGITYRNNYNSFFEDCRSNYQGNRNLYAMTLPPACRILINLRPNSSLSVSTTWKTTDLTYNFTLNKIAHIIVRYQYSAIHFAYSGYYRYRRPQYTVTRLSIDGVVQQQTASVTGTTDYAGNSGMWQGVLSAQEHHIAVQIRSGNYGYTQSSLINSDDYTRAMDIIACY